MEEFYNLFLKKKKYFFKVIKRVISNNITACNFVEDFIIFFIKYQLKFYDERKASKNVFLNVCFFTYLKSYYFKKIKKREVYEDNNNCDYNFDNIVDDRVYVEDFIEKLKNNIRESNFCDKLKKKLEMMLENKIKITNKEFYIEKLRELCWNII